MMLLRIDLFGDGVGRLVDFSRVMSRPPVTLTSTALSANFSETSSSGGFWMAFWAAIKARSSPVATLPIVALPISVMTVRTSAKSRLIRPGRTIRSVIERTPECRT